MLATNRLGLSLACFALVVLTGCAAGGIGSDIAELPAPVLLRDIDVTTLHYPGQGPFSIRFAKSSEQAGLQGTADAGASAAREGTAQAKAEAINGGKGSGTWQLGHLFKNDTTRQIDLTVRATFRFEFSAQVTPVERLAGATVSVNLFARDQRKRLLREFALTTHNTEQGAAQRKSDEDVSFTLTLAPQDSIAVFVAGQVDVDVPDGRSASAALEIKDLKLDVISKPAPRAATSQPAAAGNADGPR